MRARQGLAQQQTGVGHYRLSDGLVEKIMVLAVLVSVISSIAEFSSGLFPISMVVDALAGVFMACLLVLRARLSAHLKLGLMALTGLIVAMTAILQNPHGPDGYIILCGVAGIAFANWPLQRALVIPALAVLIMSSVAVLIQFKYLTIVSAVTQNSSIEWLLMALSMGVSILAVGCAIHELKSRLTFQIDLLETANRRLEKYAFIDDDTGLGNENFLEKTVDQELGERESGCLMVINFSGTELFYALHGQKEYDQLLRTIAAILRTGLPAGYSPAKLTGPQFAIWAPACNTPDALFSQIKRCLLAQLPLVRLGLGLHASSVQAPDNGRTYAALKKNTLVVMSMATNNEGSRCRHFLPEMESKIRAEVDLRAAIRHALDHDRFYPVYQGKVERDSHAIVGFEGLARLRSVGNNPVAGPNEFIPVLHEEGWMTEFNMIMLQKIIADIPELVRSFGNELKVAANVSPPLFLSPNFSSDLLALLQRFAVRPHCLIIEITEEVFSLDVGKIETVCRELQQSGIQISLDDFGSGFSSLSFLRAMNFNEIKIDRSFIQSASHYEKSQLLLSSMCKLGDDMLCRVVVEGVETEAQLALVEQTQCAQIQGFLFAKPLPLQAILENALA